MKCKLFFISKAICKSSLFTLDSQRIIFIKISNYLFLVFKLFINVFLCAYLNFIIFIKVFPLNIIKHSLQTFLSVIICFISILRIEDWRSWDRWFQHSSYFSIFKHLFIIYLLVPIMIFIIVKWFLYFFDIFLLFSGS